MDTVKGVTGGPHYPCSAASRRCGGRPVRAPVSPANHKKEMPLYGRQSLCISQIKNDQKQRLKEEVFLGGNLKKEQPIPFIYQVRVGIYVLTPKQKFSFLEL